MNAHELARQAMARRKARETLRESWGEWQRARTETLIAAIITVDGGLLTVQEVCADLRISRTTWYAWASELRPLAAQLAAQLDAEVGHEAALAEVDLELAYERASAPEGE